MYCTLASDCSLADSLQDSTVNIALHILAKVHIAREQPIIVAGDILATWEADGYCAVLEGRPLIPSVLDFQLDTLLIESCRQGIIRLTKSLRKKVFSPKRQENWYEVFLTIAILLFALEEVHNGQIRYIRRTKIAVGSNQHLLNFRLTM